MLSTTQWRSPPGRSGEAIRYVFKEAVNFAVEDAVHDAVEEAIHYAVARLSTTQRRSYQLHCGEAIRCTAEKLSSVSGEAIR